MTMFPPAATSTQHHLHHQNFTSYTENRCYVDINNTTSTYGGYLNHNIFGTHNLLNYVQGEGYDNFSSGDHHQTASLVGSAYSQVLMAEEDESKTETEISKAHDHEEEAAGSSSKDLIKDPAVDDEGGWLQLSIGSHAATTGSSDFSQYHHDNENKLIHDGRLIMQTGGDEEDIHRQQFVELDLLPNSSCGGGINTEVKSTTNFTQESSGIMNRSPAAAASSNQQQHYYYSPVLPPRPTNLFLQQHYYPPPPSSSSSTHYPLNPNYHNQQQVGNYQDYNPHWPAFRSSSTTSSSSSLMPPVPSYFSRLPFQLHGAAAAAAAGVDVGHHLPRFDFRVVDPPRRPHSGIWFTLQASQIQAKEPFLPQIPKSYLRIKDRQMTIRLIIKYLVNKLRLDSEAEIEIRCKGQQLLPFLTLQHVRDSIWNPRDSSSFSSSDHLQHHLMVLHYGRTTNA